MILFSHGETLTYLNKIKVLGWFEVYLVFFSSILCSQIIKLKWYSSTLKFLSFVLSFFFPGFYRGTQCSRRGLKIWSLSLQHYAIRNNPIVILVLFGNIQHVENVQNLCGCFIVYTCLRGSTPFCLQNSMNSKVMDSTGCW